MIEAFQFVLNAFLSAARSVTFVKGLEMTQMAVIRPTPEGGQN
jgi:hypothetical protein